MATNKLDGKRYLGITCRQLNDRRAKHFWEALTNDSQTYFHRSIRKHGKDNFDFVILHNFTTYEAAAQREIALIAELKPEYNQTKGGDGYLGWSPSDEQRRAMSERMKGRPGYWKGKKLPEHVVELMRTRNGRAERRAAWEANRKLGPKKAERPVVCLDTGMTFDNCSRAGEHYGLCPSSINSVCHRSEKRKTVGGMVFRFVGDNFKGEYPDDIRKIAKANQIKRLKPSHRKAVICLLDGRRFETVKDASKFYKVNNGTVIRSCRGRVKYATINKNRFVYAEAA